MRRIVLPGAVAALSGLLAGCATTQVVTPKAAPAGKLIKLAFYSDVKPNCVPNGAVSIRVVRHPSGGTLEMKPAQDFRPYTQACNMTRVEGMQLWYRGAAARTADTATVEVTYPTRNARVETFDISVR